MSTDVQLVAFCLLVANLPGRQLLVLPTFAGLPEKEPTLDDFDRDVTGRTPLPGTFAEEIEELTATGLVGTVNADGVTADGTIDGIARGVWQIDLAAWRLTDLDRWRSWRLDDVPATELKRILQQLGAGWEWRGHQH